MKKTIDELKNIISDEEKEISFIEQLSQKNINILLNRIKKDVHNANKYALSNIIISILNDIDNIEKAIDLSSSNKNLLPVLVELNNILKLFNKLLKKNNVTIINESNIIFNPNIHQAIAISESEQIKSNFIIEVMQKGYKLYERVLRPAMVVVAK
ncbi:nucleotide exchange factor GrpE [Buchnera aphidicola]|uniref:Protein GrpE n=1 Tax=Buchnera aphidicola (Sarucallis kahawaluokalani) TaxID=1241878 RepID=A0A4D6Y9B7_9GAMM|nr:nucleotide exchange factor GrpE [Buchnera aphidicola]QCI25969.1 nucleotide exchange factor GrpE [Buchnera aphidicola (Sarucallis kahawaluokalani)]